jgi:hypothetical protein
MKKKIKDQDPEFKLQINKDQYRCGGCNLPTNNDIGSFVEIEQGVDIKMCNICTGNETKTETGIKVDNEQSG